MTDRYATYNITTNRFKFYPGDERLPDEERENWKRYKFNWYPGQKCFSAIWSPGAEDWILKFVDEIEFDDTFDDVEGRVERYQKYAENHDKNAEYAQERFVNANTARQARQAQGTAEYSLEVAQHWQDRIAGAISWAEYKDRPDVIGRRIKKLESSRRKHEKELKSKQGWIKTWQGIPGNIKKKGSDETASFEEAARYLASYDSAYIGKRSTYTLLNDGEITPEEAQKVTIEKHEKSVIFHERWLAHIDKRLEYEKAYLAAVAGEEKAEEILAPKPKRKAVAPDDGFKVGDIVGTHFGNAKILKLYAKTARLEFVNQPERNERYPKGYQYGRQFLKKVEA